MYKYNVIQLTIIHFQLNHIKNENFHTNVTVSLILDFTTNVTSSC